MRLTLFLWWAAAISFLFSENICGTGGEIAPAKEEANLIIAFQALRYLLKLTTKIWCSISIITDGTVSPFAMKEITKVLQPRYGIRIYEDVFQVSSLNKTHQVLEGIIREITEMRKLHECISVVSFSDNFEFLDLFAKAYEFDPLFIWKNRPFIITSLPLEKVNDLFQRHWIIFAGNAKVLHIQGNANNKRLLKIYTHLPFSPEEGGRLFEIATWSEYKGLDGTSPNIYLDNYRKSCCSGRLSVKDSLNDPWTFSWLLHDPRTFRFKSSVQVILAAEHWSAHVTMKKLDERGTEFQFSGPMASLINSIANSMNFSYKLQQPIDGQWGSLNEDGSWTGLVGQVHRHEADFAVGPHDITEIRGKYIDYTVPIKFDARKFVVSQKQAEVDPWGFLFPLSGLVWLGLFIALVVIALLTTSFREKSDPWFLHIDSIFFHTYRLLLQQGLTMKITRTSEGVIVSCWIFVSMIVYWTYNTNLISLLAVRYAPKPIQTIRDLLDHKSMVVIFPYRTALSDYIFSTKSGQLKEVAELSKIGRYKEVPYWEFSKVLETDVSHGTHVLATDTTDSSTMIANYFTNKGICQFYRAQESFIPFVMALVCQKGSPLVSAIDFRIQAVFEGGLYQYWLDKNVPNSTACNHMPSTYTVREPLSFANIWGVFVLLLSGLLLGGAVLFLEMISGKVF